MRHFLQIFFGLLIPLIGLFIAVATGYYMLEYSFNKAINLAILVGVIIGFGVSFISAIVIFIMRAGSQPKVPVRKKEKKKKKEPIIEQTEKVSQEVSEVQSINGFITQKFILLMDKTLAFEISKYAIIAQKMNKKGHHEDFKNGLLSIKTINEFIKINISSLTRHTVEVSMEYKHNSVHAPIILEFLKEKELSFLDYQ